MESNHQSIDYKSIVYPLNEVTLLITICYFEHPARFELASLGYKSRIINLYTKDAILSTWRDLNPRDWVCNPVPLVLRHHSTTGAYLYPEVGSNHCHLHVKEIRYHYAIGAFFSVGKSICPFGTPSRIRTWTHTGRNRRLFHLS